MRFDRWSWLMVALFAIGMLVRAALYFPLAMYQIDSDAVIAGLCAFRVADGHLPAFIPGGTRISAASCYVAAAYFHLLGAGRVGLALTGLTWGALYLAFSLLFLRATLGRKLACLGFVFAIVPPEQFMTVTYAPWGYGEIMASCAATLWLAALWRNGGALGQRVAFGFSVGLGLWFSIQTLMIALPAIAWIALKRGRAVLREAIPALPAAVVGFLPYLLGNVTHGFPSLTQNWASRAASSWGQVWDNFAWLTTYLLPKLFIREYAGWWSLPALLALAYLVVAVGFVIALRARGRELGSLLLLVLAAVVLTFSFSNAGTVRGWTVRYIAPLYIVAPVACAIGVAALWRGARWLAVASVAALVIPNLLLYGLPGSALRAGLTAQMRDDERFRALLNQRGIRMVYGNYVWVYHLNFDTDERVAGVPFDAPFDYYDYGGRLGAAPVRWAAEGGKDEVLQWVRVTGTRGTATTNGDLFVFIPNQPAPNAAQLLATLRSVSH
ncbi:MAG TPA: hypothetical protein VIW73_11435 [Candidatus Cybelea sp.]